MWTTRSGTLACMTAALSAPAPGRRSISANALARALGTWDDGRGALYQRLAAAILRAIDTGDIPAGVRLPAERVLASHLQVSRGTVVAAYDLCRDTGPVERRRGSGTWVADPASGPGSVIELEAGLRARRLTNRFLSSEGDTIDLALSVLASPHDLPPDAFTPSIDALAELSHGHGYHPLGLPSLRKRIAELHTHAGLPTRTDQIAITLGGQQAIALTARLLISPGDVVLVDTATYPGAIDAYARAGAQFDTVPFNAGGTQPEQLERQIAHSTPRLVYLIPSCHNPTGTIMPDHRRQAIAKIGDTTDTWIIEDESLAWAAFDATTRHPIAAYSHGTRTITIGSLSKLFWGGLRIGWIRADHNVIARIGRLKAAHDLGNCSVSQAIALRLLDDTDTITQMRRDQLRTGAAHMSELIASKLPDWQFRRPDGGLSMWVQLPQGPADEFAKVARRHGVSVLPGSAASARETHLDCIRLAYSHPPTLLTQAVERLAQAWEEFRSASDAVTSAALG